MSQAELITSIPEDHPRFEARQLAWMDGQSAARPARWKQDAFRKHQRIRSQKGLVAANQWFLTLATDIDQCKIKPGITDADIIDLATSQAKLANDRAKRWAHQGIGRARREVEKLVVQWGLTPPREKLAAEAALARMVDPTWWRRKLRNEAARNRENIARALGYVHKKRDPHISRESLEAERHKERRNAALLEDMEALSEDGEILTLAEIAEHGISNPAIRRGDLMTRIKGMENCAIKAGHVGLFVTWTCPSRMHARYDNGAEVPTFDSTTPRSAESYLQGLWERVRSRLRHEGIGAYGLRIAEPHHDGTPHWHLLLFVEPLHTYTVKHVLREYALIDSPTEPGAGTHRVKFERIDPAKGGAANYVAKYIGKNIDGTGIDLDENGIPALESVGRVTAWARIHGIRQFQFIGGPPVGLYREFRRIPEGNVKDAPHQIAAAWLAVQKTVDRQVDFGAFINAAGGPLARRNEQPIRLSTDTEQRQGRYGWELVTVPRGVFHMQRPERRYKSERKAWQIRPKTGGFGRESIGDWAAAHRPWTRVNNCADQSPCGFPAESERHSAPNVIPFPARPGASPPGLRPRPENHPGELP